MKRALIGIVPDKLLNRKKKAIHQPLPKNISTEWARLADMRLQMVVSSTGIIDQNQFLEVLQKARRNEEVPVGTLKRVLTLESWLGHLAIHGVLASSTSTTRAESFSLEAKDLEAPAQPRV